MSYVSLRPYARYTNPLPSWYHSILHTLKYGQAFLPASLSLFLRNQTPHLSLELNIFYLNIYIHHHLSCAAPRIYYPVVFLFQIYSIRSYGLQTFDMLTLKNNLLQSLLHPHRVRIHPQHNKTTEYHHAPYSALHRLP